MDPAIEPAVAASFLSKLPRELVEPLLAQVFRSEGLVRATQAGLEVLDATQLYQQSQVTD